MATVIQYQNMPKTYPCPFCSATSKRVNKTMGGAYYVCRTHGNFFVKSKERAKEYNIPDKKGGIVRPSRNTKLVLPKRRGLVVARSPMPEMQ